MSDTPRTDEYINSKPWLDYETNGDTKSFMRKLERELNEAKRINNQPIGCGGTPAIGNTMGSSIGQMILSEVLNRNGLGRAGDGGVTK
jgi:hypothetical protein